MELMPIMKDCSGVSFLLHGTLGFLSLDTQQPFRSFLGAFAQATVSTNQHNPTQKRKRTRTPTPIHTAHVGIRWNTTIRRNAQWFCNCDVYRQ